jgi:dolichol-phosphate mannosyltransferase
VVVPTLNEAGGIAALLSQILALHPDARCLVVDDGSRDGTLDIVRDLGARDGRIGLIDRTEEPVKGLSASAWDGILKCTTPYFVVMDGDGQHPPEYLHRCFRALDLGADVSLGAREPFGTRWKFTRIVTSATAAFLAKARLLICGVTISDPMSGYFGGRTEFFRELYEKNSRRMIMQGYKILFDTLKCIPADAHLSGFYYPFGLRVHDASKFDLKVIIRFLQSLIT